MILNNKSSQLLSIFVFQTISSFGLFNFFFLPLTYESSVGLQAHGSAVSHTARGRLRGGLAVVLEISEPGSEMHTHTYTHKEMKTVFYPSAQKNRVCILKCFDNFILGFGFELTETTQTTLCKSTKNTKQRIRLLQTRIKTKCCITTMC